MNQAMQNMRLHSDNKSGVTGVTWRKNFKRWHVRIFASGKEIFIGSYMNYDDAVAARKAAEEKYFGEYSYSKTISAVPRIAVQPN